MTISHSFYNNNESHRWLPEGLRLAAIASFFMTKNSETGRRGEQIALDYLRERGFLIEARNWRSGRYEIDIVAQHSAITHFVEVRTRRAGALLSPEHTITPTKADAMRRAASAYLAQHRVMGEVAFDLIAVDLFPDGSYDVRMVADAVEFGW